MYVKSLSLAPLAALAITPCVEAQSFNIDVGDDIGTPASTYGAAANQTGFWNSATDAAMTPFEITLSDLSGTPTGVTTSVVNVCVGCSGENNFDNATTSGDDELLLDDFLDIGLPTSSSIWTFNGLADGVYTVYTYAWAPDSPSFFTRVTPQGAMEDVIVGGTWTGSHAEEVTYSRHVVNVSGGTLVMDLTPVGSFGTIGGFQIVTGDDGVGPGTDFCFGDGGDQMGCTDCMCMNNAPQGSGGGCLNSNGGSAKLIATGQASVSGDTLRFDALDANPATFGILVSADVQMPGNPMNPCFGLNTGIAPIVLDGLRCIAQNEIRHGSRATDANGDIGATNNGWGPPSGPMGGLIGQGGFNAGQTRHWQLFYREVDTLGCMTGQNTSNGVSTTFAP